MHNPPQPAQSCTPESLVALGKGYPTLESLGINGVDGRHVTDGDLEQIFVAVPGWKLFVPEADTCFTVRALISLKKSWPLIEARFPGPGPQSALPLFSNLQNMVVSEPFHWENRSIRKLST